MTNSNHIAQLDPRIQKAAQSFLTEAAVNGINLRIYSSYRSPQEQDGLYQKGRTTAGNIVTNAPACSSWHNYRLAIDVVEIKEGKALWENPNWQKIGQLGKKHGFEWGGDWKSFVDRPHFQQRFGKSLDQMRATCQNPNANPPPILSEKIEPREQSSSTAPTSEPVNTNFNFDVSQVTNRFASLQNSSGSSALGNLNLFFYENKKIIGYTLGAAGLGGVLWYIIKK